MTTSADSLDAELVMLIRQGDETAWKHLIDAYEGRLLAFARSRLQNQSAAEDVVQETLLGFLTSLPNYNVSQTPLESFLFRIAAYKITDVLRKQGRRSAVFPLEDRLTLLGNERRASSLARSREQGHQQRQFLVQQLSTLIQEWKQQQNYERLKTCELLFLRGWSNKQTAEFLQISEQQVANHKQSVTSRLKLQQQKSGK